MLKYWKAHHFEHIKNAQSYAELFPIAHEVLECMPPPVGQVCGPISTGGAGSVEKNLERFKVVIGDLQRQNIEIFDQTPFEEPMQRIKAAREGTYGEYDTAILDDFYLPLFESKLIHHLYFLSDWESSTGARWEHKQAVRLGIDIIYVG